MTIPTNDLAEEILSEVCDDYIKGEYDIQFYTDDEERRVSILSRDKLIEFEWDLNEPTLTSDLLFLDAHSFCAWVIRNHNNANAKRWKNAKGSRKVVLG